MQPTQSHPELSRLEFLIGKWNTEGHTHTTADTPSVKIKGTDTYEWISDGSFILHTVSVTIGDEQVSNTEIIGYDHEFKRYPMYSFDNSGTVQIMSAEFNPDGQLVIDGNTMRATLHTNLHATEMTAYWRLFQNGEWQDWMQVTLSRD